MNITDKIESLKRQATTNRNQGYNDLATEQEQLSSWLQELIELREKNKPDRMTIKDALLSNEIRKMIQEASE